MTDYPEYILTRPPNCPSKWDHLSPAAEESTTVYLPKCSARGSGMGVGDDVAETSPPLDSFSSAV